MSTFLRGGRDKLASVEVPDVQASEGQQELSFRMAKPDIKDWTLLFLAVFSFFAVLLRGVALLLGKGDQFPWHQGIGLFLPILMFLNRHDRFIYSRWSLQIADGTAFNTIKGVVQKSLVIKESEISGGSLFSGEVQVHLPDDWVGAQPAKLLAALSLVRQGATLSELVKESLKQPENPKVVWVEDAAIFETDGIMFMAFGILFSLFGFSLMAKSSSDWLMLAFGVLIFSAGLYVSARNWRSKGDVASIGYRIDGSMLSGKADGQIDTQIDLAQEKLTIQYWNGLTRHSLRIGWVDDKGTFRALTHWQDRITEDLSRIVTAAAAQGNLPEVVKWSEPK